jgi:S-DNA-T family DNA segregation ATPase FtsK/SpoIIIE
VLAPEDPPMIKEERLSQIPRAARKNFALPPLKLLDYDAVAPIKIDEGQLRIQADRLEKTFEQFGIKGHVREIRPGPVVTLFEFVPGPGIKLTRIAALADDIAMAMVAMHVRIVAPIPGKGAVGIEIPNERRELVYLKEIVANPVYAREPHKLCMALGKTIDGKAYFANLADMPHVLVAGTTGSGKSVSVNAMICSILYRATPDEVRFVMIDPKMLELSIYDGIPHLLMPPIIDSKKAANALRWAVREMEHRYQLLNESGVRDIDSYNKKSTNKMSYLVIVVDEYADLIAVAGKDVEGYVMRLAQKARAAGIHVMLATQRPSVDVITGVIKANFPVRMGFRLASAHDSKTIINRSGAEALLGKGDMLLIPPGSSDLVRVHGAYVSDKELNRVVDFWKAQGQPNYDPTLVSATEEEPDGQGILVPEDSDDKYKEAVNVVLRTRKCSTSWLQRQLGIGYNRAARIVEQMEREGVVGPIQNAKGEREIFGANAGSDGDTAFP